MIGISSEHVELGELVHKFLCERDSRAATRAAGFDGPARLPDYWREMGAMGWLGLHVPEEHGGSGYGLAELVVVAEQLGRAAAGGPFLATVAASALLVTAGSEVLKAELLPGLADGRIVAGCISHGRIEGGLLDIDDGSLAFGGPPDVLVVTAGDDVCLVDSHSAGVLVSVGSALDLAEVVSTVSAHGVPVDGHRILRGARRHLDLLIRLLAAADAVGGAVACVEAAAQYAKDRHAFGRPVGQFQAVKHHCATMLTLTELATAAVWQATASAAAGSFAEAEDAVDAAITVALPAYVKCSSLNIQVHGGIGFTWEQDAHLYFRRAGALRAVADPRGDAAARVAGRLRESARRPAAAAAVGRSSIPAEVSRSVETVVAAEPAERLAVLVATGLLYPEFPPPWGIGAGAELQLSVDRALTGLNRGALLDPMTAWMVPIVVPTLIRHGTTDQQERWILPTLTDALRWCQLFSEPGAGSDLAALTTRAVPFAGGWLVSGQKVWTSSALQASLGLALVRTDRDAPKHEGITCMVVDLAAAGVTVRPLRDMTGECDFNEVFLDEVAVPERDVLGAVGEGWTVARTALSNERVSLAAKPETFCDAAVAAAADTVLGPTSAVELGTLAANERAIAALNQRAVARSIAGESTVAESSVAKLAGAEHEQAATDFALRAAGDRVLLMDDDPQSPQMRWLRARRATIAGGTSEILRNVIAERLLGLPRDPS